MEDILKKLEIGLTNEKDSLTDSVKSREVIITQYLKSITLLISKIKEVSSVYRNEIVEIEKHKTLLENEVKLLKKTQSESIALTDTKVKESKKILSGIEKDITDKQSEVSSLNRKADGIVSEIRTLQNESESLRSQNSSLDRSNRELKADLSKNTKLVSDLKDEHSKIVSLIESDKKISSNLKSEISILSKRNK